VTSSSIAAFFSAGVRNYFSFLLRLHRVGKASPSAVRPVSQGRRDLPRSACRPPCVIVDSGTGACPSVFELWLPPVIALRTCAISVFEGGPETTGAQRKGLFRCLASSPLYRAALPLRSELISFKVMIVFRDVLFPPVLLTVHFPPSSSLAVSF